MPQIEAEPKIRVSLHMLISYARARVPWSICIERIPVLYGGDLELFEEACADRQRKEQHHLEVLVLRRVHITVDVEEEHHVHESQVLGTVGN